MRLAVGDSYRAEAGVQRKDDCNNQMREDDSFVQGVSNRNEGKAIEFWVQLEGKPTLYFALLGEYK